MSATISVERLPSAWQDRLREYKLVVDGSRVASVRQGQSAEVAVEPGHHRAWMRISWCRSRILDVDVADGEQVRLVCRAGASPLLALLYITVWQARYIDLQAE
jgi:hypothetical protein